MDARKKSVLRAMGLGLVVFGALLIAAEGNASNNCSFTRVDTVMILDGDCATDSTILVPDGFTLDGSDYTITAIDPADGHFKGAVVANAGTTAHVMNLVIDTLVLADVCDGGADRLRGILFDGASGTIMNNTVNNLNQGQSVCQEGNAIEVRNEPLDGTHPNTRSVTVSHNLVTAWQKGGIIANGDVWVTITHNEVGASATQASLAANSVQFGFGGGGLLMYNQIAGNQWLGWSTASDFVATAVLLYQTAPGSNVRQNNIMDGNADVGLFIYGDGLVVDKNRVFDAGTDAGGYDIGIANYGVDNVITNNKIRGFDMPYVGVTGSINRVISGPGGQKADPSL